MDPSLIASVLERIPTAWRDEFESKRTCFASPIADMRLDHPTVPVDTQLRCEFENGYVLLIKPGTAGAPEVSISLPQGFPQFPRACTYAFGYYRNTHATWPIRDTAMLLRQLERTSMAEMEDDVETEDDE